MVGVWGSGGGGGWDVKERGQGRGGGGEHTGVPCWGPMYPKHTPYPPHHTTSHPQVLSLNHTNVTSACLRELAQLPWLRSLALAGSRVSEAGVARLKARAHPDLIIKHTPPPPPPGARVFA